MFVYFLSVVKHSTQKLVWAEIMDFCHTDVHGVADLCLLKSFLLGGLSLTVEEEKVRAEPELLCGERRRRANRKSGRDFIFSRSYLGLPRTQTLSQDPNPSQTRKGAKM